MWWLHSFALTHILFSRCNEVVFPVISVICFVSERQIAIVLHYEMAKLPMCGYRGMVGFPYALEVFLPSCLKGCLQNLQHRMLQQGDFCLCCVVVPGL